MTPYRIFKQENLQQAVGHQSCIMLDKDNGCTGECLAGISLYQTTTFPTPQTHAYQEGFYVIEGEGHALVGNDEFSITPGTCFLVPVGVEHSIRRSERAEHVKVFWFHSE